MLLLAPLAVFLILFFLQPVVLFFIQSFGFPKPSLHSYREALATPTYLKIIWDTLRLSFIVALCCLIVGYPLAFCVTQASSRWRPWLWTAVLLPFWTSVLVRSYAWIVILRVHGVLDTALNGIGITAPPRLLYNQAGVIIGMTQVLLPYMVLTLYGVMREIDLRYVRAAASLGAPPFSAFLRVYLRLSMPGVTSGFLVTFLLAVGFYITPALLGGGNVLMISLQIAQQISELVNWPFGSALSTVLVVIVVGLVVLFVYAFNVRAFGLGAAPPPPVAAEEPGAATNRAATPAIVVPQDPRPRSPTNRVYRRPPLPWRRWGLVGVSVAACLFLVVPVLIVVVMSFSGAPYLTFPPQGFSLRWYVAFFTGQEWISAAMISLRAAAITAVFSTILGSLAALAFVRGHFRGQSAVYVLALLPMIVPVIVTAVAIYSLFASLHLIGNVWGFAIADTVLALPLVVLIVSASLRGVDPSLERAAMTLGAAPVRAFWSVTLPTVTPALVAGALFAFITSFDESVITLFLSSTTTATLPKVMWDSLRFEIDPTISAISALLVAMSTVVLATTALFMDRRAQTRIG